MASEKLAAGPEPPQQPPPPPQQQQPPPAGLIAVGAGAGAGGVGAAVMGELRASGSGAVVLPAGMINPSVPIRNIRMKFAVLIGLIQVGEVSNRDIVETVLNLVSPRPAPPAGLPFAPPLPACKCSRPPRPALPRGHLQPPHAHVGKTQPRAPGA